MGLSRLLEIFASFSLFKFITDWRHENTLREQARLQAQVEMKRIDGEQRKELIETVRLLIKEGQVSKETSAKIVRSVLTNEPSQGFSTSARAENANSVAPTRTAQSSFSREKERLVELNGDRT